MARLPNLGALRPLSLVLLAAAGLACADSQGACPAPPPPSQCEKIADILPGKVNYPNSSAYKTSLASYFSTQEESIQPACIVSPSNTNDVAVVVKALAAGRGDFAIRSGGHTPFGGAANIAQGVTIDLSALHTITLSDSNSVVSVGPGARWGDVYAMLDPLQLTALGGRGASIGVGGFLVGGGISFLSPRLGWACDSSNTLGYEVVLASGQVVYATAKGQYSDLFLALKGGSNNFGIVTRFDLKTYELGNFWGGFIAYPMTELQPTLSAFSGFMNPKNYDSYADMIFAIGYSNPGGVQSISLGLQYTKPVADPAVFKPFVNTAAEEFSSMRISNMSDFTTEEDTHNPIGFRQLYMEETFAHSDGIYDSIYSIFNASASLVSSVAGVQYYLIFQPTPALTGTNSLGLNPADKRLVIALMSVSYTDPADDTIVNNAVKSFFSNLHSLVQRKNLDRDYIYLNYAAPFQDPISGYGAVNKRKLQLTSKKYDPRGMFQSQVPGGFKLFT